jgi:hypothetical protein
VSEKAIKGFDVVFGYSMRTMQLSSPWLRKISSNPALDFKRDPDGSAQRTIKALSELNVVSQNSLNPTAHPLKFLVTLFGFRL